MRYRFLLPVILSGTVLTCAAAYAVTDAELTACFKAHAQLMEKPALRNLITCWRVHGYLMERRSK